MIKVVWWLKPFDDKRKIHWWLKLIELPLRTNRWTDRQMDNTKTRVDFATEKNLNNEKKFLGPIIYEWNCDWIKAVTFVY